MNELPQNIQVKTESVQNIADSIRAKNHSNQKYKIGEMSGAIDDMKVAIPNTMLTIEHNGVYDVSTDEKVSVEVPVPSGAIEITQNGRTDVKDYEYANVQVPQPSGSYSINQNGSYNIKDYAYVDVNTPSYITGTTKTITTNGTGIDVSTYELADVNVKPLIKNFASMTFECDLTDPDSFYDYINQFDWSNVTNFSFQPTLCTKIKMPSNVHPVNFLITLPYNTDDYYLETIELFDTSNMTTMTNMFLGRRGLKNVPEFDTTNVTSMNNMFYMSRQYTYSRFVMTDDSLNNILNMCRKSAVTTNKKLSALFNNWSYLQSADKTTLITRIQGLSNYQSFIDSGWTIE